MAPTTQGTGKRLARAALTLGMLLVLDALLVLVWMDTEPFSDGPGVAQQGLFSFYVLPLVTLLLVPFVPLRTWVLVGEAMSDGGDRGGPLLAVELGAVVLSGLFLALTWGALLLR